MDQTTRDGDRTKGMATSSMSPDQPHHDTASQPLGAGGAIGAATEIARNVGEQARSAAATTTATAQDLARRAREQAAPAANAIYEQGARAGEYVTRNVHEYPATALLIAGAIGYGLAYLIHSGGWSSLGWSSSERHGRDDGGHGGRRHGG